MDREKEKKKLIKLLSLRPSLLIGSQMKTKVKGINIYRIEMKVYKIGIFKWNLYIIYIYINLYKFIIYMAYL